MRVKLRNVSQVDVDTTTYQEEKKGRKSTHQLLTCTTHPLSIFTPMFVVHPLSCARCESSSSSQQRSCQAAAAAHPFPHSAISCTRFTTPPPSDTPTNNASRRILLRDTNLISRTRRSVWHASSQAHLVGSSSLRPKDQARAAAHRPTRTTDLTC